MLTLNEVLNYILILKEEEMNNNYRLSKEQEQLITKVTKAIKENPSLKEKISKISLAETMSERSQIWNDRVVITQKVQIVPEVQQEPVQEIEQGGKQKVKVPVKKAGFADALVMALVTGFMGGVAAAYIYLII